MIILCFIHFWDFLNFKGFVLCLLVGFLDWIPVKEIGANLSQELLRWEASR